MHHLCLQASTPKMASAEACARSHAHPRLLFAWGMLGQRSSRGTLRAGQRSSAEFAEALAPLLASSIWAWCSGRVLASEAKLIVNRLLDLPHGPQHANNMPDKHPGGFVRNLPDKLHRGQ